MFKQNAFFRRKIFLVAIGILLGIGLFGEGLPVDALTCGCGCGPLAADGNILPGHATAFEVASCGPCQNNCNAWCGENGFNTPGTSVCREAAPAPAPRPRVVDPNQNCVDRALTARGISTRRHDAIESSVRTIETATGNLRATWTCQGLPNNIVDPSRCISDACIGAPFCCVPGTGDRAVTGQTPASPGGAAAAPTAGGSTAVTNCAEVSVAAGTPRATVIAIAGQTGTETSSWTCQRVCSADRQNKCVQDGCPDNGDAAVLCCPPTIGIAPGAVCGAAGAPGGDTPGTGSNDGSGGASGGATSIGLAQLVLPPCMTSHDPQVAGKCQLADVFTLGYNAVRFMFGLSGALLLVAFMVAGFKYLVNGYAGDIKSAKETMINAALGMIIMLFAYIIVDFLYMALTT